MPLEASTAIDLKEILPLHDQERHTGRAMAKHNPKKLLAPVPTTAGINQVDFCKIFAAIINQEQ